MSASQWVSHVSGGCPTSVAGCVALRYMYKLAFGVCYAKSGVGDGRCTRRLRVRRDFHHGLWAAVVVASSYDSTLARQFGFALVSSFLSSRSS